MKTLSYPKPNQAINSTSYCPELIQLEEGAYLDTFQPNQRPGKHHFPVSSQLLRGGGKYYIPPVSRPDPKKIAAAVAPILRGVSANRINALNEIAKLSGNKPELWIKPKFGDFEYWLAHNCGWISDEEVRVDTTAYQTKSQLALKTSHRFSTQRFTWTEQPRFEEPRDTGEYAPEVNMKLIKDRNLTDSARRIAMFIMRIAYQDNRAGRFIGMTVSFIMKGLSISRRTVQRSLTLLETRGYFRCEVAKGDTTRMCIGLIVHLLSPLFPQHHKEKWPESRRNREVSTMPLKQRHFYQQIYNAKNKVLRMTWAIRCMNGVFRSVSKYKPMTQANIERFKHAPSKQQKITTYCLNLPVQRI